MPLLRQDSFQIHSKGTLCNEWCPLLSGKGSSLYFMTLQRQVVSKEDIKVVKKEIAFLVRE